MTVTLIVAHAEKRVIGHNNDLPWHLPSDLQYFKKQTLHKTVIMGRKTYESIGKPLPQRRNIVITRNKNYHAEGVEVCHSLKEAIALSKQDTSEIMVIGGEQIFREALPLADKLLITDIYHSFEGDTYFPEYLQDFILAHSSELNDHEGIKYQYKEFKRVGVL